MVGVVSVARGAALTLILAAAGCGGSGSGLPTAGAPAVGQSAMPMDLTQQKASPASLLVWGVLGAAPPRAVEQTTLGISALPKPGAPVPVALSLAKVLPGSECPKVDFRNFDPDLDVILPDPVNIFLDFETAAGDQCVSGTETETGRVELTLRGGDVLSGGRILPKSGVDLVVTENYPLWTRKVTDATHVVTYTFGGTRTVRIQADGTTVTTTDPFATRLSLTQDASSGLKLYQRYYSISNLSITRTPMAGVGTEPAYTEEGTLHFACSGTLQMAGAPDAADPECTGFADVTLQAVLHDPAVCDGAPTGGLMTFVAAGQKMEVFFDYGALYQTNPGANCGRAHVRRTGDTTAGTERFEPTPPVL